METPSSDLKSDVLNLSGRMAVELDKLPETAVEQAVARVLRDTLDCRTGKVPMFDSSL